MAGYVYIMTNKSLRGLIKVGMTAKHPKARAKELNHTGLPNNFVVEHYWQSDDPRRDEAAAHRALSRYRAKKEFFRVDLNTAIAEIDQAITQPTVYNKQEYIHKKEAEKAESRRREIAAREDREIDRLSRRVSVLESGGPDRSGWAYLLAWAGLSLLFSRIAESRDEVYFIAAAVGTFVLIFYLSHRDDTKKRWVRDVEAAKKALKEAKDKRSPDLASEVLAPPVGESPSRRASVPERAGNNQVLTTARLTNNNPNDWRQFMPKDPPRHSPDIDDAMKSLRSRVIHLPHIKDD